MSEPNVLVSFRLDVKRPVRIRWLAADGAPGRGYKAQVTAIKLLNGARLPMHPTAILEQMKPDPSGAEGTYTLSFSGVVGFAEDHPDRAAIDKLHDQEINYELEIVQDETGRLAVEDADYEVLERPRGFASKVTNITKAR